MTRILIVEDDADQAELLGMLLAERGHVVEVAHDAEAALEKAGTFRPGLVLLDLGLPRVSGYEIAERLAALPERSSMRVVALSGHGTEEARRRSLAAGCDAHLVKGGTLKEMIALAESVGRGET